MARGRIRKPDKLSYYIEEWSLDELTYYNDEAIQIKEKLFNKFYDTIKWNEGKYDYSLDDVNQFENSRGDLIIIIGHRGSDPNAFNEMLKDNSIPFENYPFERMI